MFLTPGHTASQLTWFAICFVVSFVVVYKVLLPKITHMIQSRENFTNKMNYQIESFVQQSQKLGAQSQKLEISINNKVRIAKHELIQKMLAEFEANKVRILAEYTKKQIEAEKEILIAKQELFNELQHKLPVLTEKITKKYMQ